MLRTLLCCLLLVSLVTTGCGEHKGSEHTLPVSPVADKPDAKADGPLSYNRDIRPILSDKCFACHGPDSAAREADLRLDMPEGTDQYDGAYFAIEPGDPDASELVSRIFSKKSKLVMPPPAFKVTLTDEEKALLVRWIEEGAKYEPHWSFVPVAEKIELPDVQNEKWVRDPIDRFVLARLETEGLSPAKEADPLRWLRRVTYDLTGLPPTLQEIDAFVADKSGKAYENATDRLLASPQYGERMAVPWLDMARYADTHGFSVDKSRLSWPWRDWVIASYNENLPYDQFLTWQLAGDLLPDATQEQVLATAFNRLHRMNAEGGSLREEWRNESVADRLHTFGTAFMGQTFECARCHDHRYDPVSQANYYELFAFFNSIDESGTTSFARGDIVSPPTLLLSSDAHAAELAKRQVRVDEAEQGLDQLLVEREQAFKQWLATKPKPDGIADQIGDYGFDTLEKNKLANRIEGGGEGGVGVVESPANPTLEPGILGQALRFDGDNYAFMPGMADLDRWTPFTVALWFKVDEVDDAKPRVIAKRTSGTDVAPFGFDLMLDGGRVVARAYRHWPGNAIGVSTGEIVKPGEWVHVVWRYDGSSRASGLSLMINGKPADLDIVRDGPMLKPVGGGGYFGSKAKELIIGQRFRDRGLSGGMVDEVKLVRRAVSDLEGQSFFENKAIAEAVASADESALRSYYFSVVDEPVRQARKELQAKRKAYIEYEKGIPEIAVMKDMPEPRPSHVLARGLYNAERNEDNRVYRDVPESIKPWVEGHPRNRLGLAQWLTHPKHPLTSRVAVNRLWQICFGQGIVASEDNFGLQGALPTHPELLDYLARSYMDSGWDTKALLKRIVLSATYRQDSATTPEQWKNDPGNALLARGSARRLDAEMIRDTALSASGLLVRKLGGAPAYPYQPGGLWKEVSSSSYRVGSGESLYRRSLYTVWKRAVPMPNMMAFDTPTREACTAERLPTNTPLQALVLLNDVQYVEAARVLAQHVMKQAEGDTERIALGFTLLAGRAPTKTEATRLAELLIAQRELFKTKPEEAKKLLAVGQSKRDESLDVFEHAAVTVVMHAILNLDATIWRR